MKTNLNDAACFYLLVTCTRLSADFQPMGRVSCRYQPTCSAYALKALEKHGAIKGSFLTARRIGRCHPLGGSGIDNVPD